MSIDAAVASKLCEAFGSDNVYPDGRWLTTDPTTGEATLNADLPVIMYRQTGGNGSMSLDQGRGGLRDETFLVEVFANGRDDCAKVRDKLLGFFGGPLNSAKPGDWQDWGSGGDVCRVHWATIDDPSAGAEFPETDAHLLFRFVRMVLSVQWHKG